jgi:predicted nuclease with RNAse H fold/adenylate kinase family enzyme
MPRLARQLCSTLAQQTAGLPATPHDDEFIRPIGLSHKARPFHVLRRAWAERRAGVGRLQRELDRRFGRWPRVVGIDLRAKASNPTGWALCFGSRVDTKIIYTDDEIVDLSLQANPDLISIDAPLSLPRGRSSVYDDSPCRKTGGIVRDAERILWSRGIRVYPALIRHMQGLTSRGILLTKEFERRGIPVIESYPGAAQDILGIPRKKVDEDLLLGGLCEFGYTIRSAKSHDELDAVTSAMVGYFYLADQYEAIGADDEGYMIIPKWPGMTWAGRETIAPAGKRVVSLVGLPGAGKTSVARALAKRLGWDCLVLGDALRVRALSDVSLRDSLSRGDLAPERLVQEILRDAIKKCVKHGLVLDGFPRHAQQISIGRKLFTDWLVIHLDIDPSKAARRISRRITCVSCGFVAAVATYKQRLCPICANRKWQPRAEDTALVIQRQLNEWKTGVEQLWCLLTPELRVRIDGSGPINEVVANAERAIAAAKFSGEPPALL